VPRDYFQGEERGDQENVRGARGGTAYIRIVRDGTGVRLRERRGQQGLRRSRPGEGVAWWKDLNTKKKLRKCGMWLLLAGAPNHEGMGEQKTRKKRVVEKR